MNADGNDTYYGYPPIWYTSGSPFQYDTPQSTFVGTCRFCGRRFWRDSMRGLTGRWNRPSTNDFCDDCHKKINKARTRARDWQQGHDAAMRGEHDNPYRKDSAID